MLPNLLSGIILGMTTDIYSLYFAPVGMITGLMAGIANMPMGEVALMSSLQLGYVPLLFVGMFVFIMLAGPGKVSVDYLLSLYFTNKDSLNELKNF